MHVQDLSDSEKLAWGEPGKPHSAGSGQGTDSATIPGGDQTIRPYPVEVRLVGGTLPSRILYWVALVTLVLLAVTSLVTPVALLVFSRKLVEELPGLIKEIKEQTDTSRRTK